ncbi:MAG: arsenite methyltransferase [Bacteroidetes bacterium]|nr:arsenite methyltransferase [Bacteroidota bacterium]
MSEKIKEIVRQKYTEVVTQNTGSCYDTLCCSPTGDSPFKESYDHLDGYEPDADFGLGCGIPTDTALIKKGQTVLDLGSGAGNDVFVARSMVGEKGKVIGVDMTTAMVEKANMNKAKLGYENVEFLLGEIEDLPLQNELIDVAISNCVMNLVPDKNKAYQEVFRVLKKNGHFSISDVVLSGEMPEKIKNAAEMYAGCVSGALLKSDYLSAIEKAGFSNMKIEKEREIYLPDEVLSNFLDEQEITAFRKSGSKVLSITVVAEKPCCAPGCC